MKRLASCSYHRSVWGKQYVARAETNCRKRASAVFTAYLRRPEH